MSTFTRLVSCSALAAAAWAAYETRDTPMISVSLALALVGLAIFAWRRGRKRTEADMFQDLSVSTLVFPPEARPKRSSSRHVRTD